MQITEFRLKDVRCFAGEHVVRIRPLTFLVGENSTGKSTILGCMHAVGNSHRRFSRGEEYVNFNEPPYNMGSYSDILRKSRPANECFELGITYIYNGRDELKYPIQFTFQERSGGTDPVMTEEKYVLRGGEIILERVDHEIERLFHIDRLQSNTNNPVFKIKIHNSMPSRFLSSITHLIMTDNSGKIPEENRDLDSLLKGNKITDYNPFRGTKIESLAPVRSEPKRTYDPTAQIADPGGADIPMLLMNLARGNESDWQGMQQQLIEFGKESGLFSDIQMRQLGRTGSDPFQIRVVALGPKVNLIDTGYGVSQALPILVHIFGPREGILMIQQPEVHLHPRGQAALASLLVKRVNGRSKRRSRDRPGFVIETHSDYMMDRARIEIRKGNIDARDVSLVYLEKAKDRGVNVHNITFDEMGNMENVPPGYRSFFLREVDELFGHEG